MIKVYEDPNQKLKREEFFSELDNDVMNLDSIINEHIAAFEEKYLGKIKIDKIETGHFTKEDCPHPDEKGDIGKVHCTVHLKLNI